MNNRNLPIFTFFENLQREYICAEIRTKIFQKRYITYWKKVMEGKRLKIEDIASKNRLKSIFNNRDEYLKIYGEIIPEWGMPIFSYRDEVQREKLEKWDIIFFFNRESEIKILNEDDTTSIGEIVDNSNCLKEFPVLQVRKRKVEECFIVPIKRVSRIL